jgi:hypothetical protein
MTLSLNPGFYVRDNGIDWQITGVSLQKPLSDISREKNSADVSEITEYQRSFIVKNGVTSLPSS